MVPLCEIGNDLNNNGLFIQGSTPTTASVANLNPYSIPSLLSATATTPSITSGGSWISPHLPLLALAFDRYVCHTLEFCYEPQSTATTEDRLVFAWTDDPAHPFLSAIGSLGASTPSQLELLVTEDSVAFMPWKAWQLKVPVAKDQRFLFDQPISEEGEPSQARFTDFGSFSCVGSAAPTTTVQYGILYINIVLDLFDPVPIVSSVATLISDLRRVRTHHKSKQRRLGTDLSPSLEVKSESKIPIDQLHPRVAKTMMIDDYVVTPTPTSSSSSLNVRVPVTIDVHRGSRANF
jgi:hypothetical protein